MTRIRSLVGVGVRRFDFSDRASVVEVLQGVDRALFISSDAVGSRGPAQVDAVGAAAEAGVAHLVYTSVVNADRPEMAVSEEHRATERAIAAAFPGSHTILRNNLYTELVLASLESAVATGQLFTARGDGRIAYVTRGGAAPARPGGGRSARTGGWGVRGVRALGGGRAAR